MISLTQTETGSIRSAAARLCRKAAMLSGLLLSRPRSTSVARRIGARPSTAQRSAKGCRC